MMENALVSAKTNLAVTKRAADKASVDVTKAEEQKVQQDLYVDWLMDKVCLLSCHNQGVTLHSCGTHRSNQYKLKCLNCRTPTTPPVKPYGTFVFRVNFHLYSVLISMITLQL